MEMRTFSLYFKLDSFIGTPLSECNTMSFFKHFSAQTLRYSSAAAC